MTTPNDKSMKKYIAIFGAAVLLVSMAPAGSTAAASQQLRTVAWWKMNEKSGTVLRDATGHGFRGTIGDKIRLNGESHLFTKTDPSRQVQISGRINTIPDYSRLDPGMAPFRVTAKFLWRRGARDRNIIQKGQGSPEGGGFKMKTQVSDDGTQRTIWCRFYGANGISSSVYAWDFKRRMDDDKWHTVSCWRTATNMTKLSVDGKLYDTNDNDLGSISNDWPISIGGNIICWKGQARSCNYWHGRIGFIKWEVGRK